MHACFLYVKLWLETGGYFGYKSYAITKGFSKINWVLNTFY